MNQSSLIMKNNSSMITDNREHRENNREHKSTVEFIVTKRQINPSQLLDIIILKSANVGTEHNLLLGKVEIKKESRKQK